MFKVLLKSRLASLKSMFLGAGRKNNQSSKGKMILFGLLMLYVFACIMFMLYGMFSQLAGPFGKAGLGWLYFAMYTVMDLSLIIIGSIFLAKSQLYEARDNELLLSMPIKPRDILGSRMAMLLIMNYVYGLAVTIPAGVAWLGSSGQAVSAGQIISFVLVSLLLPLLALALSCLLAWLLSAVSNRMRSRAMVDTILSVIFLLAYFYAINKMNTAIAALAANGDEIAGKLGSVAPLYWVGAGVSDMNWLYVLLTAAICLVPFGLIYALLSATFIKTATAKRGFAKIKYVDKGQRVSTAFSALYHRELSRLLSSSTYLMNAGLGVVFMVIGAVLLVVKAGAVKGFMTQIPNGGETLAPLAMLALCLLSGMTTLSAPSVSLEGKNIWISQSLPLAAGEILKSKLALHISLLLPAAVLDIIAVIIVLKPSGLTLALMIVLPMLFVFFTAVLGLMANLRHPFMDWTTEAQPIKQGAAVLIAMFGSWGVIAVPAVLVFALSSISPALVMLGFTVLIVVLTWLMYRWIMTSGVKIYSEL